MRRISHLRVRHRHEALRSNGPRKVLDGQEPRARVLCSPLDDRVWRHQSVSDPVRFTANCLWNFEMSRWMAEGVLFAVYDKPGSRLKDLVCDFSLVLSPMLLEELLDVLALIGCVSVRSKHITPVTKLSPFKGTL